MTQRADTQLPPAPESPPKERLWGRSFARLVCAVLALLGVLPIALAFFLRSDFARNWSTKQTAKLLHEQGIEAHYDVALGLWPLGIELKNVVIDASDGGSPFFQAKRAIIRPRLFSLLSGKLVVDLIDVEAPRARIVVRDGELKNLALKLPKSSGEKKPFHAPFDVFAITDGDVDLTIDGTHVQARELDVDVTAEDDALRGSSFEIAVRAGTTNVVRARDQGGGGVAFDDDSMCSLDGRVRVTPTELIVRRVHLLGFAALDDAPSTSPACSLAEDDTKRVDVEVSHLDVKLAADPRQLPDIDGHLRARIPVGLAHRFAKLPALDGYVFVDADVHHVKGQNLPEIHGHVRAGLIKLDKYRFADYLDADVDVHDNVVTSSKAIVELADGRVTLTDVRVDPLAPGAPIRAKADIGNVDFVELMRALGVSPHPHVAWNVRTIQMANFGGTLDPIKLDGDFTASTTNFAVYDKATDDPKRMRMIGFDSAQLAAHLAVRADSVQFRNVRADLPHSHLEGGYCLIGYNNELRVDVPKGDVGLEDITPLAGLPIVGRAQVSEVHVFSSMLDPHVTGDASIAGFSLSDMPFGDISQAHAALDGRVLSLHGVKATKGKSSFEMPNARLDFGGEHGMVMDAELTAAPMNLRDLLDIFHLNDDPRFDELDADLRGDTRFHMSLGGVEDTCGGGFITVHANPHLQSVMLLGERFDDGDADFDLRWRDREAGIAGASLELHSLTLHKARREKDGTVLGSLLASANIAEGGALHGNAVIEGIPLSHVQTLGPAAGYVDGTVSGIAQIGGTVDAFTADVDADVSPVHVRRAEFGPSKLHVTVTQDPPKQTIIGHTACGAPKFALFDKVAYLKDTASHGLITVVGDMFGGEVHLEHVEMTRQRQGEITGRLLLRRLELAALANAATAPDDTEGSLAHLDGELSGELTLDKIRQGDYANAALHFLPKSLLVDKDGKKLLLRPTTSALVLADDVLTLPPLELELSAIGGFSGVVTLSGNVKDVTGEPKLDLSAALAPVDLGLLAGVIPRVEHARGTFGGALHVTGSTSDPTIDGDVHVRDGEFVVTGLPSPITEVNVDVSADKSELRVTRGTAHFAGGTLTLDGRAPIRNLALGGLEGHLSARGIHMAPSEGINVGLDADLTIAMDELGVDKRKLPRVSGDILITSFDYTRPINLVSDLNALGGGRSKRTEVEVYDPSLDSLWLDLRVRSDVPLRIRNNLIEAQLSLGSGALVVSGTNQRFGLRGEMRTLAGGHFRLPFGSNVFDIRQGVIRFDDPTRVDPNVDIVAVTEYRRSADSSTSSSSSGRAGASWRITLHAYGAGDDLKVDMTSEPALSQEDIVLLLTIGITRAEADQIQAGNLGTGVALEALSALSGASSAVRSAIPVIDDFRFGSAYSAATGRTEPIITVGKRLTKDVTANVSTGFSENRELRANILWRLSQKVSVQGSYDNVNNNVTSTAVGNVGVDLRFRLEFE